MPNLLIALLATVTIATANAVSFEMRAHGLEQRWQAAQAAGVPAGSLEAARRQVSEERRRRLDGLPYPLVSGAAWNDPLRLPEATTEAAVRAAGDAAHQRAMAAFDRLRDAAGPNGEGAEPAAAAALGAARRPGDLDALTRRWNAEAARQADARARLGAESGGLSQALPADVMSEAGRLQDLAVRTERTGLTTRDASLAMVQAQRYLTAGYPEQVAGHPAIMAALRAAAGRLQQRLDLRSHADQLLAELPGLLYQARQYGAGADFDPRAGQVRAGLDAARAARSDDRLDAALADLQRLDDDLRAAAGGRLPTAGIPCQAGAPAQQIVIHLATQQLVAYENGCPILRTPITTGRPALPTERGTFRLFYKAPAYHMVSPWPPSSPFYYPPTWVSNAMEFISNGTFLHSASWQPDSTYGPDSQYGPYASHGCVHVLDGPLQQLYDWAAIGATVVVEE